MSKHRQQLLPFEGDKEADRRERCERLLSRLGQPPEKLATAARMFDYEEATAIARASNARGAARSTATNKRNVDTARKFV